MDVMGDAVAGSGIEDAVAGTERLQEAVLVHVLVVDLQDVVVDVHHRERDGAPLHLQRLELEGGHGAGGVLDQDLVGFELDLLPRNEVTPREMAAQQLLGKVAWRPHACHTSLSARDVLRAGSLEWMVRASTLSLLVRRISRAWTRSSTSRPDASSYP